MKVNVCEQANKVNMMCVCLLARPHLKLETNDTLIVVRQQPRIGRSTVYIYQPVNRFKTIRLLQL